MSDSKYKIVYCTPALYSAGGVERIVSVKANYFADVLGYDVTVIVTEGKGRASFFPLSDKVKVVNFELGFEELWRASFFRKVLLYLQKQRQFKKLLTAELMRIRPDFTISMLRREINFLTDIRDGSKKIGELHVNRANYRNFEQNESNALKKLFAKLWMDSLVSKLTKLDRLVVLTEKSKASWPELSNVEVIPDPLPFQVEVKSDLHAKRIISIGRYAYQKGYDILLESWRLVEKTHPDWSLHIYGSHDGGVGDYKRLQEHIDDYKIGNVFLHQSTNDIYSCYAESDFYVMSSRFESFGLVLIEAMSCGLPVISFDCKYGPKSIIQKGETGMLVPQGDIKEMAKAICLMIENDEGRQRMAVNARQESKKYHPQNIMPIWHEFYESLV